MQQVRRGTDHDLRTVLENLTDAVGTRDTTARQNHEVHVAGTPVDAPQTDPHSPVEAKVDRVTGADPVVPERVAVLGGTLLHLELGEHLMEELPRRSGRVEILL